jgi:hypothetical protein
VCQNIVDDGAGYDKKPIVKVVARQTRYAQQLLRRPKGSGGAEVILSLKGFDLAERLRAMTLLAEGEEAEESFVEQEMVFHGSIMPEATEEEALARAEGWSDAEDTAWIDGSRLEDGRVGCSEVEEVEEVVEDGGQQTLGGASLPLKKADEYVCQTRGAQPAFLKRSALRVSSPGLPRAGPTSRPGQGASERSSGMRRRRSPLGISSF